MPQLRVHGAAVGRMAVVVTAVLITLVSSGTGENALPGLQIVLTEGGINKATEHVVPQIFEQLGTVEVDDQKGSSGGFTYKISDVRIHDFGFDMLSPLIGLNERDNSVELRLHDIRAVCDLKFVWWSPLTKISSGGVARVHLKRGAMQTTASVGIDGEKTSVTVKKTDVKFGDFALDLQGSYLKWVYVAVAEFVRYTLLWKLEALVAQRLQDTMQAEANKAVRTIPFVHPIDKDVSLDVGLVRAPKVYRDRIEFAHKGRFFTADEEEAAAPHAAGGGFGPVTPGSPFMFAVQVQERFANSLTHAYFVAGKLQADLSPGTVPDPNVARGLNTMFLEHLMPAVFARYPASPLSLRVKATESPSVTMTDGVVRMFFGASVDCIVANSNGGEDNLFTVSADGASLVENIQISDNFHITGNIQHAFIQGLSVRHSNVGAVPTETLKQMANFAIKFFALEEINKVLKEGIALPGVQGAAIKDAVVRVGQGSLNIDANASYTLKP